MEVGGGGGGRGIRVNFFLSSELWSSQICLDLIFPLQWGGGGVVANGVFLEFWMPNLPRSNFPFTVRGGDGGWWVNLFFFEFWTLVKPNLHRSFFKIFCGATDTPGLDFWWCLLGFQSQSGFCLIHTWWRCMSTHSLRFTSIATPPDLLAASMAVEPISSTYLRMHWWESNGGRPLTPWANA